MGRTDRTLIDRRDYLRLAGGLAASATAGLAGCSSTVPGASDGDSNGDGTGSDGSTATGLLSTAVSDDPGDIGDFESCIVTIDGIWVGPETSGSGDGSEEDGGENETDDENETDAEGETDDENGSETNETEQDDGGGPPADAPGGGGQSSSGDEASGSQGDSETDADGGNRTEADAPDEGPEDGDSGGEDGESGEDESDGAGEGDGNGRTYHEFDEPQEADLTELRGEAQQLVGEHELSVGTYRFLQLDISGIRGTLTDGSEARVETPGEAPLKFNQSFDVREGYRTTFLADFTPVGRGNGSYLFRPVASETEVSYHEVESGSDGSSGDTETDSSWNATDTDGETGSDGGDETGTDGEGGDAAGTGGGNQMAADGGNRTA